MRIANRDEIERLNNELQDVLDSMPKEILARAARLLGMYVALYKAHFGDLAPEDYRRLNAHVAAQDKLGRSIYRAGMGELMSMLDLVREHTECDEEAASGQETHRRSVN